MHIGTAGWLVGATYPQELASLRRLAPDLPLLVPGIGAQGADLASTLAAVRIVPGTPVLINSSRAIICAGDGPDFAEKARDAAVTMMPRSERRGADRRRDTAARRPGSCPQLAVVRRAYRFRSAKLAVVVAASLTMTLDVFGR